MKTSTPHAFVVIITGALPPGVLPEHASDQILPLLMNSLAIGPHLRGSALVVSDRDPIALLKTLADSVPKLPEGPKIVTN